MPWPIQDAFSFSLWITHLLQFRQICAFGVVDMLQKSQRTSALRWTSLRLLVSHYTFMGRWVLWPNLKHNFKLVRATIWRKGFQPKHLINRESRRPCLRAATWKCWTSDKAKTSVLATRPVSGPFHLALVKPDLKFTILSRSILLHSIWRQVVDTWEKIHIWEQIQFGWQNLPLRGPTSDNLPLSRK